MKIRMLCSSWLEPGDRRFSPVQLQKAVFLVIKAGLAGLPAEAYDFQPYHYGPFDINIYHDAEALHEEGALLRAPVAAWGMDGHYDNAYRPGKSRRSARWVATRDRYKDRRYRS